MTRKKKHRDSIQKPIKSPFIIITTVQNDPRSRRPNQKISRISRMKPLQRGQFPLLTQSSLEQRRQNVWPQGIKAAPLFLTLQTQHMDANSPSFSHEFSSFPSCSCSSSSSNS
ncbi:hypothetical protein IEQ34_000882 [Dendrobium chrysotoxum]|uniref:Uncharacterized protein n=1 Tax=Dendrobium chrysotoxum TaxID=161865 RepID=A0AAV7HSF0_DENCH|nr:hypothetical protein IEQ34_000882 [Dendrobium chrysotoxum]